MHFWSKKEKPVENVGFASIFAAINAIMALLMAFFPALSVPFAFLLPPLSAFVGYLCKGKYVLAYALSASLLSLAVSSFNVFESLLTVVPSILVGSLFGFLLSKQIGGAFAVFFVSLLQFGLNFGIAKILEITTTINPIDLFLDIFKIERTERILSLIPSFVMALSILQTVITDLLIGALSARFPRREANGSPHPVLSYLAPFLGFTFTALSIGIGWISLLWGALFLCFSIYFGIASTSSFLGQKRKWIYLVLIVSFIGVFFLRAALSPICPNGILLYSLFTLPLDFLAPVSNLLKRKDKDEVS